MFITGAHVAVNFVLYRKKKVAPWVGHVPHIYLQRVFNFGMLTTQTSPNYFAVTTIFHYATMDDIQHPTADVKMSGKTELKTFLPQ